MTDYKQNALKLHKQLKGKISINLKGKLDSVEALSTYYTPGVGAVSDYLAQHPNAGKLYTWTNNLVAVISDGSAVLGLGDIGPTASLPVMEGKCMLFKHFAGIDAIPIVLNVHSEEEIINTVQALAPSFGGINLEDIAAPKCFAIEEKLKKILNIPIMHDDQHGTAIVVLAGLINACKVANKNLAKTKIVLVGAGAAGVAIAKLLYEFAPTIDLILVDSIGIINKTRSDLNDTKKTLLKITNKNNLSGSLTDALIGADIFIGVSKANLLTEKMIKLMNNKSIIFALANPDPEIIPTIAKKAGAFIVATGRSDYPNQINNVLAFPGIFRGALDNNVKKITTQHKLKTAQAIADLVNKPSVENIIPSVFNNQLVPTISRLII